MTVTVRDASCAALEVAATKDGRPVLSLEDRAVEIVVDASRSMWGQINGEAKMSIAKNILNDVSYWFPQDLDLALRAYGSMSPSESNNCGDSRLLVPFSEYNREPIRAAISGLRPTGQTPIAFALNQAASDFGSLQSDRAVVQIKFTQPFLREIVVFAGFVHSRHHTNKAVGPVFLHGIEEQRIVILMFGCA